MFDFPILSLTTFLPTVGALAILLIQGDEQTVARNARATALWTSLATFIVSIFLWIGFDTSTADFQFVEKAAWIPALHHRKNGAKRNEFAAATNWGTNRSS